MPMKMKMIPLLDAQGDPETIPSDFHENVAYTVCDWVNRALVERSNHYVDWKYDYLGREDIEQLSGRLLEATRRMDLFNLALNWYQSVGNPSDLREKPWVIENYDPTDCGAIELWFLFKEDNNGNTYRVLFKMVWED